MAGNILILSSGLWRLREEVAMLTGLTPVFGTAIPPKAAAIAGWGHKPTATRARRIARHRGIPYIGIEDGFLRSLKPGNSMRPLALVMDKRGIYYDARVASDLEHIINAGGFSAEETALAARLGDMLRVRRISKYNASPDRPALPFKQYVLVIDQTAGDASIEGGLAGATTFADMMDVALRDAGDIPVVAKLHPETITGQKQGFLAAHAASSKITVMAQACNPWDLIAGAVRVYTVSSQLGFEAVMAGREVHCFGAPFYAGWGVTYDRASMPRRTRAAPVPEIIAAAYLRYSHYFDAWTRKPISAETAIDQLAFLRDTYLGNGAPVIFYRLPIWKRKPLERLLDGPVSAPRHMRNLDEALRSAKQTHARLAAWGKTANALRPDAKADGVGLLSIEDGFLRSAGLGAALTPSVSFTMDSKGIYYDPAGPSDLEDLLQRFDVNEALIARASALKTKIIASNLSKYNLQSTAILPPFPPAKRKILVIGQVADDEAVLKSLSGGAGNINAVMLSTVRQQAPDAFLIYKPHPDVERLGRAGHIGETELGKLCDVVFRDAPIGQSLAAVDEVAVFTSLAGFEALLRGKTVRTFGQPFYGGWGLTLDAMAFPRRSRKRTLEELLAITLIVYPQYYDAGSGLPCPAEVAVERLLAMKDRPPQAIDGLREIVGRGIVLARSMTRPRR